MIMLSELLYLIAVMAAVQVGISLPIRTAETIQTCAVIMLNCPSILAFPYPLGKIRQQPAFTGRPSTMPSPAITLTTKNG